MRLVFSHISLLNAVTVEEHNKNIVNVLERQQTIRHGV